MAQPIQNYTASVASTGSEHKDLRAKDSQASSSDHLMYLAMVAILESIGEAGSMGASIAKISTTLYDTLVKNGTEKLQKMQEELEEMNDLEQNWTQFANYMKTGKIPAPFSSYSPAQLQEMKDLYNQYGGNLSGFRKGVNLFAQGLSTQNTVIQNNKLIPDNEQQQVKTLVDDQSTFATQLASFLRVMKDQWTNS